MTKLQKIMSLASGVVLLLMAVLVLMLPEEGYIIILLFFAVTMLIGGISNLIYYFTMAKRMVGGLSVLYRGVLTLDLSLFTLSLPGLPTLYISLYLVGSYAFLGIIDILRALESKKRGAPSWRFNVIVGAVHLVLAAVCLIFINEPRIMMTVYALGLLYSAAMRIVNVFRRTAIVYIQ